MDFEKGKKSGLTTASAVLICSAGNNAVGIVMSLREIGWEGKIVCLKPDIGQFVPADGWPNLCECVPVNFEKPEDMPSWIRENLTPGTLKAVFFTDERFLSIFSSKTLADEFSSVKFHVGAKKHLDESLDKWKFYEFVQANGFAKVPRTFRADQDPWKLFSGPFRTRVWKSWSGANKLPRGGNVKNARDLERWLQFVAEKGLTDADWGYQELLSTNTQHKYAVSGWHDGDTRLYVTTRWVKERRENGWIIERAADPGGLQDATRRILSAMNYCGPFEMEFMKDLHNESYKVIELNPRFWLQHRIVGNELVRLYLGAAAPSTEAASVGSVERRTARYWINTDEAIWRLLTLRNVNMLQHYFRNISSLPLRGALRAALTVRLSICKRHLLQIVRDRFRGESNEVTSKAEH